MQQGLVYYLRSVIGAWGIVLSLFGTNAVALDPARPAADGTVSFEAQIKPLLMRSCAACHGGGQDKGDFRIDTRQTILDSGSVVPGRSEGSYLIELVTSEDPDVMMPKQGTPLTADEVALLRAWIDQDLPWQEGFSFANRGERAELKPREVALPEVGADVTHPVDRLLRAYLAEQDLPLPESVNDVTYARRAWQDTIGLPPAPEQLAAFLADSSPDKRQRLVSRLLADRRNYAEHWLSFWNDCLRNDYRGTGYIDGGRKQITDWLYRSLHENKPYDQFVHELLSPTPESEGFIRGIIWRGTVNASQRAEVQAAQNLSQVFLGINLKCASCHDSFIDDWKLEDAYGLAAVFAEGPLEIHHCDKPTGKDASIKFLFSELGEIDAAADRPQRLQQLADLMTSDENGRLARTVVNRLWAQFYGRGLVEPVDDMDAPAWNRDLLDWLAADLAAHDYDLQHTIRLILSSESYAWPAVPAAEIAQAEYVFRGPEVRRLSAEQFLDAISTLTGVWQSAAEQGFHPPLEATTAPSSSSVSQASEISDAVPATVGQERVLYRSGVVNQGLHDIDVDVRGVRTLCLLVTDSDGNRTLDWADWIEPVLVGPDGETPLTELAWTSATTGYGEIQLNKNIVGGALKAAGHEAAFGIGTHAPSAIVYHLPPGIERFRAKCGPDEGATSQSASGHDMEFLVIGDRRLRAALVAADPLMRAMGRPNREQIVTRRASAATTLEALELTNGDTLDNTLRQGAELWLAASSPDAPNALIRELYLRALGRVPNETESLLAQEIVGTPATVNGVHDLLWVIAMLPEFQLIH